MAGAKYSFQLVPRLRLVTHCPRGSASQIRKDRGKERCRPGQVLELNTWRARTGPGLRRLPKTPGPWREITRFSPSKRNDPNSAGFLVRRKRRPLMPGGRAATEARSGCYNNAAVRRPATPLAGFRYKTSPWAGPGVTADGLVTIMESETRSALVLNRTRESKPQCRTVDP